MCFSVADDSGYRCSHLPVCRYRGYRCHRPDSQVGNLDNLNTVSTERDCVALLEMSTRYNPCRLVGGE